MRAFPDIQVTLSPFKGQRAPYGLKVECEWEECSAARFWMKVDVGVPYQFISYGTVQLPPAVLESHKKGMPTHGSVSVPISSSRSSIEFEADQPFLREMIVIRIRPETE